MKRLRSKDSNERLSELRMVPQCSCKVGQKESSLTDRLFVFVYCVQM